MQRVFLMGGIPLALWIVPRAPAHSGSNALGVDGLLALSGDGAVDEKSVRSSEPTALRELRLAAASLVRRCDSPRLFVSLVF